MKNFNEWLKTRDPQLHRNLQHEDSLLPHIDPNTGMIVNTDEPRPGEVGYAPNSRFGIGN